MNKRKCEDGYIVYIRHRGIYKCTCKHKSFYTWPDVELRSYILYLLLIHQIKCRKPCGVEYPPLFYSIRTKLIPTCKYRCDIGKVLR